MESNRRVLAAVSAALALGLAQNAALAQDSKAKEKCYGIAKAGLNDCASLNGSHSCAGQAKADKLPEDWRYVAKGACSGMGGLTFEEARKRLKK